MAECGPSVRLNQGGGNNHNQKGNGALTGCFEIGALGLTVKPIELETGLRPNSAGIPVTLLFRTEAIGFPTFLLLL